jgi:very-short-patch-repair endonuclease
MDGFAEGPVELTGTRAVELNADWITLHKADTLDENDVMRVNGLRVTTWTRAVFDVAQVCFEHEVEHALEYCLRTRHTNVPKLTDYLKRIGTQGRRGVRLLREMLEIRAPGYVPTGGFFETELMRYMRKRQVPKPTNQFEVFDGPRLIARLDFAWPHLKLAVEPDGEATHSPWKQRERDAERRNELARLGWLVMVVTWTRFKEHPDEVVEEIWQAITNARAASARWTPPESKEPNPPLVLQGQLPLFGG